MRRIGDVEVTRIEEVNLREPPIMFAEWRKEMAGEYDWLVPDFYIPEADNFQVSIHSWLLRTPSHTILIDTCGGNAKVRPASPRFHQLNTPYLERLQAAGVAPGDVDYVICTHFHVDHVGWNTRLVEGRWVPTFPKATYILSRIECEARDPRRDPSKAPTPGNLIFLDSVLPVIEAGQARLVEGDERILEGIGLMPTHGHSPGQMAVRVQSRGEEGMFIGDVMHHPLQIYNPGWNSRFCEDAETARRTRLRVLGHCADHDSLMLPAHFARPHCGKVVRRGERFAFVPAAQ
jgi:glyoxylase-like metal-dependent hydrolase (beta-lactamase superfamily II)